ncbi:MAG: hypothetical protein Q7S16_00970 [bacterium]|nr:hypothetical protein [bacterium]
MPIEDKDVEYAFAYAQELYQASLPDMELPGERDAHQNALQVRIFCEVMRLYAASSHPEIFSFLESFCEKTTPKVERIRFRAQLARVRTKRLSPLAIMSWASRNAPHIDTSGEKAIDSDPSFKMPNLDEIALPVEYTSAEDFNAVLRHGDDRHDIEAEAEEMLKQGNCVRAFELAASLPQSDKDEIAARNAFLNQAGNLALDQGKEDIAEECAKRIRNDQTRALLLVKLFKRKRRDDLRIEIETLVMKEVPAFDDQWQVTIARILADTTGNTTILQSVQQRVEGGRQQTQEEDPLEESEEDLREEKEDEEYDQDWELFGDRIKTLEQYQSQNLLGKLIGQAAMAWSYAERAERFAKIWKVTKDPRHLELTRTRALEVAADDLQGLKDVACELYPATKDPNDLERWRQAIYNIEKPIQRLEELITFCAVKTGLFPI